MGDFGSIFAEQQRRAESGIWDFPSHGSIQILEEFLEYAGEHMEFSSQIQLNHLTGHCRKPKKR